MTVNGKCLIGELTGQRRVVGRSIAPTVTEWTSQVFGTEEASPVLWRRCTGTGGNFTTAIKSRPLGRLHTDAEGSSRYAGVMRFRFS